jgi:predicted nucleotidyltransferase|tara:strand:- start:46 stop:456 length:411 start_codon:yes stop_codon:yes gene_type:complete
MEKANVNSNAEERAESLNQIIFEREFDPNLSLSENFQKIVDAARNKSEYRSKEFDPLGISSATQLKRLSVSDKDKPKLKAILGNTSLDDVASQYNAPLVGNYDVKKHLLNFLIRKQKGYQTGGYVMNYGDYGRSYK